MPWVQEQIDDANKDKQKAEKDKSSKREADKNQRSIEGFFSKSKTVEKPEVKPIKAKIKEESKTVSKDDIDPVIYLKLLSGVIKMANVEEFEWRYKPNVIANGKLQAGPERELKDLQCILISVNWANHDYLLDNKDG